jgi:hypothetical protein
MTIDFAARARALLGTRFRPQGRRPEVGLDCVGLILCVFGLPEYEGRRDYRLRGNHRRELMGALGNRFRRVALTQHRAGDVMLLQLAADQFHLGIVTASGFVHADARLGKVVETPGAPAWTIIAAFRARVRKQRQG